MAGRSALQAQMIVGDRYRLLHRMGADAAVETWEAHDARLDRPVALRLLTDGAQGDPDARAKLRGVARESALPGAQSAAPRVLDGGDDPNYGPFVVAELNAAFEATQRIPTVDPAPAADPASVAPAAIDAPRSTEFAARPRVAPLRAGRKTSGPLALALVLLAICALVGAVYAARSLTPAAAPVATAAATSASAPDPTAPAKTAPAAAPGTSAVRATSAPATSAPAAAPATAAPARTAPATSAPAAAAPPVAGNPVDTIKQHYGLIDARRYTESYQLMDTRLRAENSQAVYNSWFAGKVSLKPVSVDLVSQNAQQATVRATVLSTDTVNGRNVTSQVTEQFVLRPENGAWRIDTVTRLDEQPVNGANRGRSGNRDDNGQGNTGD